MKDQNEYRSGIITSENRNHVFHANGYTFTFMDSVANSRDMNTLIPSPDGFIYGKLHDGHDIGIYIGKQKEFPIYRNRRLITGAYYVMQHQSDNSDIAGLWGVEFCGGTLNALLNRSQKSCDYAGDDKIVVDDPDITRTYTLNVGSEVWHLTIGAHSKWSSGVNGVHVNDAGVHLRIVFPCKKTEGEFFNIHTAFKELLSFLTFRKNVGFDEIYFLNATDEYGYNMRRAQVYIRNDETITSKDWFQCISFDDLGSCLPALVDLMLRNNEKDYMLGFLPQNDTNVMRMSPMRLREVCSALECELSFVDGLQATEEKNLSELIKQVKSLVKAHRSTSSRLHDKTYDVIFGSINHWSLAAADQIYLLYRRYEDILINITNASHDIGVDEINRLVKYRNSITHGRHRIIDEDIGVTAYILQGLVYCCILTRIGMDRETIKSLLVERRTLF